MSELEKMLQGDWYDSRDPQLLEMYHTARALMKQLNMLDSTQFEEKAATLKALLQQVEKGVWIETPFFCDYGQFIRIGENTFVNANCMFQDNNAIQIGSNCLIGPSVQLYTAIHPIDAKERIVTIDSQTRYLTKSKPIKIGNNCWIGGNTVILPGITIGDNVTIGAGSVVTKDVPADCIAVGNPCRLLDR